MHSPALPAGPAARKGFIAGVGRGGLEYFSPAAGRLLAYHCGAGAGRGGRDGQEAVTGLVRALL